MESSEGNIKCAIIYVKATLSQVIVWKYNIFQFYSDTAFVKGVVQHAKLQSNFSDVYFYEFSYHGKLGGDTMYVPGEYLV